MPDKLYWDSNVFLAIIQKEQNRQIACNTLAKAEHKEILIVTSALTIAEVLWLKNAPKLTKDKAKILHEFFRRSYIRIVNLDRKIAEMAQQLVWQNSVKPKDAIHVATARLYKCPTLETFDNELIGLNNDIKDIEIRTPKPTGQAGLLL